MNRFINRVFFQNAGPIAYEKISSDRRAKLKRTIIKNNRCNYHELFSLFSGQKAANPHNSVGVMENSC